MSKNLKFAFAVSIALHTLLITPFFLLSTPQEKKSELKFCSLQNVNFQKEERPLPQKYTKKIEKKPQEKQIKSEQKIKAAAKADAAETPVVRTDGQNKTEPTQQTKYTEQLAPTTPQKNTLEQEAKVDQVKEYLKANPFAIREAIKKFKRYPPIAIKMGCEGVAKVSFRPRADGGVDSIELAQSSGFSILDKSSLKTVEEAAEYMPKPPSTVTITVPIEYRLE